LPPGLASAPTVLGWQKRFLSVRNRHALNDQPGRGRRNLWVPSLVEAIASAMSQPPLRRGYMDCSLRLTDVLRASRLPLGGSISARGHLRGGRLHASDQRGYAWLAKITLDKTRLAWRPLGLTGYGGDIVIANPIGRKVIPCSLARTAVASLPSFSGVASGSREPFVAVVALPVVLPQHFGWVLAAAVLRFVRARILVGFLLGQSLRALPLPGLRTMGTCFTQCVLCNGFQPPFGKYRPRHILFPG
jgi:hypothetical protein